MNSPFAVGMQVHAVPDDERAYDSAGRKLPFAYEYANSSLNRRYQAEKGPFGKPSSRRSYSRTKTTTPLTKDDLARAETTKTIDDIFGPLLAEQKERHAAREQQKLPQAQPSSLDRPVADLGIAQTGPSGPAQPRKILEPVEVMLYGFPSDFQYAAIDYYEKASGGHIFEDYDREPPHPRYNKTLSTRQSFIPKSLPRDAIARINAYKGGEYWIKVTFDSPEAAEQACHYSPKIINGYRVYCELFRGVGPNADVAIPAQPGDTDEVNDLDVFTSGSLKHRRPQRLEPHLRQFNTLPAGAASSLALLQPPASPTPSDTTASSGTATASGTDAAVNRGLSLFGRTSTNALALNNNNNNPSSPPPNTTTSTSTTSSPSKPLLIPTATRAVLRPASEALLPVPHWTTRAFGTWPLLGALVGGDGSGAADLIGAVVPRTEGPDGALGGFDAARASVWWRLWWWVDGLFGTDFCGVRGEE